MAGDDPGDDSGVEKVSTAGQRSQSGATGSKGFPWLWVVGVIAAVCIPFFSILKLRRTKVQEDETQT
jgi:hypothetical protein